MKKYLLVLLIIFSLLFMVSCEKKSGDNEPSVYNSVTEEEWNNNVKDYAFAKKADTKLIIKVYSSPDDGNEPDYILYKDGLVYKFVVVVSENEYISYGDYVNNVGYKYYGIDRNNYYKFDNKDSIEATMESFITDFNIEYSKVKFEDNEYISIIPYEGEEKYGHYSFVNGVLKEFSVYFDNSLDFKMTIEPMNNHIELPNVNYVNQMPNSEMKIYLSEALKELKSYGAIGSDYTVEAYEHYTIAKFEYLRTKNSDDSYKTVEEIVDGIKTILVDNFFSKRASILGQVESLDEYCWFGSFEGGNKNGLIIKLIPTDGKVMAVLAVTDYDIADVLVLKEYLENRLVDDVEEDEFIFDSTVMIDTKDCLLLQYHTEMTGEFEQLVDYAVTCISDNGYEWVESGSSMNYHYDILENGNKGVRVYFTEGDEGCYDITVTFCVSFCDKSPSTIIDFGVDSPLFE